MCQKLIKGILTKTRYLISIPYNYIIFTLFIKALDSPEPSLSFYWSITCSLCLCFCIKIFLCIGSITNRYLLIIIKLIKIIKNAIKECIFCFYYNIMIRYVGEQLQRNCKFTKPCYTRKNLYMNK
jgi:glucan phosphoethanolaminetransferase (alkaline phosphatase superfamily)